MSKNTTSKIAILNIISTLILQGMTFISAPIISRLLGAADYGIVATYSAWVNVFASTFGLQTQCTIAISKSDFTTPKEQNKYQSAVLFLSSVAYMTFALIIFAFSRYIESILQLRKWLLLLMVVHGFGQFCVSFANIKFTQEYKAWSNLILSVTSSSVAFGLSVYLISSFPIGTNFYGRILGLLVPCMICGLSVYTYILCSGKTLINLKAWKYCLPLCLPIVVHNLSTIILNQSDRIMIQSMIGDSAAGVYSLAATFTAVLSTMWSALNNSWVPFFYEFSRNKDFKNLQIHGANYLELFTVISCGFVLLSTEAYYLFASAEYWSGVPTVIVLSIGGYFTFLYSFPVNYEFFRKRTKTIAVGTLLAAIFNFTLNIIMIKLCGVLGAAIATAFAHIMLFVLHNYNASKISDVNDPYQFKLKIILPYLSAFLAVVLISFIFREQSILRWTIGIVIGLIELYRICKRRMIF